MGREDLDGDEIEEDSSSDYGKRRGRKRAARDRQNRQRLNTRPQVSHLMIIWLSL